MNRPLAEELFTDRIEDLSRDHKLILSAMTFSPADWTLIGDLHTVMTPAELATRALSGTYPTMSLAWFVVRSLRLAWHGSVVDSKNVRLLKRGLLEQFDFYFNKNMSLEQKNMMKVSCFSFHYLIP